MAVNSLHTLEGVEAEIERVQQLIVDAQALIDGATADTTEYTVTEEKVGQASLKTGGAGSSYVKDLLAQIKDSTDYLKWLVKRHLQMTAKSVTTLGSIHSSTSGARFVR